MDAEAFCILPCQHGWVSRSFFLHQGHFFSNLFPLFYGMWKYVISFWSDGWVWKGFRSIFQEVCSSCSYFPSRYEGSHPPVASLLTNLWGRCFHPLKQLLNYNFAVVRRLLPWKSQNTESAGCLCDVRSVQFCAGVCSGVCELEFLMMLVSQCLSQSPAVRLRSWLIIKVVMLRRQK